MRSVFRQIEPGLWTAEAQVKMPAMMLDARTTLLEVAPKKLILISPLHPKMCDYDSLKMLGEVVAIASPNCFHHLFAGHAKVLFPQAKLWGAPGLKKKRPDLAWEGTLTEDLWPYEDSVSLCLIEGGPKVNEVAFFHRLSRTLVVTDLVFNLQNAQGLGARVVLGLFGTFKKLNLSRLFLLFHRNRKRLGQSLSELLTLDFERLVMAHGEIIDRDAKVQIRPILEKLI